jgi:DNA-binding MarR family transcriptional regulator
MGKLRDRLQVHAASVTNAVDRLERDGLVRRLPNPRDGRGTLAEITSRGRKLVAKVTPVLNEQVFVDAGVSDRQADELTGLLRKVRQSAGDFQSQKV